MGRLAAAAVLAIATVGLGGTSQASELAGRTTLHQRLGGGNPDAAFSFLSTRAGEPYLLREDGVGQAVQPTAARSRARA